jgi:hypothetical protein
MQIEGRKAGHVISSTGLREQLWTSDVTVSAIGYVWTTSSDCSGGLFHVQVPLGLPPEGRFVFTMLCQQCSVGPVQTPHRYTVEVPLPHGVTFVQTRSRVPCSVRDTLILV